MKFSNIYFGLTSREVTIIVIFAILILFAVLSVNAIVHQTKDYVFVSNAHSLKKATERYQLSTGLLGKDSITEKISYRTLVANGYIQPFKDPDTNEIMPTNNDSFVTIVKSSGKIQYFVCYKGQQRKLCDKAGGVDVGIPFTALNRNLISAK